MGAGAEGGDEDYGEDGGEGEDEEDEAAGGAGLGGHDGVKCGGDLAIVDGFVFACWMWMVDTRRGDTVNKGKPQ